MRRFPLILAFLFFASPPLLRAQERPGVEVGARAGLNILFDGGETIFTLAGGGPSPLGSLVAGNTAVHVAFFPSPQFMIEPLVSFGVASNSETFTNLTLAAQGAYLFNGATTNSAYVGATAAFNSIDLGDLTDSETDFAVGGTVGYRILPRPNAAIRLEAGYRRWLDFEINEIDAAVIFGVIF